MVTNSVIYCELQLIETFQDKKIPGNPEIVS